MIALRHRVRLALAAGILAVVGLAGAKEPAVPPAQELKEAIETLKDVYEKDYKAAETDAKAKQALARKLFDGAGKRKTAAMQYASYDEARRLAAGSGEAKLALDAVAALTTKFKGTPPELAADTLKLLADAELTPEAAAGLLALAAEGANDALDLQDYAGAVALGKLAVAAAKKTDDPDKLVESKAFLGKIEALKAAVDTVKTRPDDPNANELLGQYWTFTRGRWDVGLKYLAKGANKEFAAAARKDLDNPRSAKERTAVADTWYKLAKDYKGAEQRRLIDRAWEWYSGAVAVAVGDEDL